MSIRASETLGTALVSSQDKQKSNQSCGEAGFRRYLLEQTGVGRPKYLWPWKGARNPSMKKQKSLILHLPLITVAGSPSLSS
ncbi:hypothetical protein OSB04_027868 [Centaurea solstitialis]|uniref:Uncharacterized protein n=1 Tax=Centaurea solstitialis TaxID=347529 RepID=A0AA38SY66_9ASTR|nr:hypothetical protein OSB04_027868 [Centaurea solstitialis]